MTNLQTISAYTQYDFESTNKNIRWENIDTTKLTHQGIEIFSFVPLKDIKKRFSETGLYSKTEIDSMIKGLSELPEYAKNKRKQKSGKKD